MATQPIADRYVPVEEYLATIYEPDCEYDDGAIVERNLGEFEHAFLQTLLSAIFTNHMETWGVFALVEQRIQIAPSKYRIPDVCVLRVGAPRAKILTHPPLIAIEVLSPEDTIRRATSKVAEYREFGIENIWGIDPSARVAYRGGAAELEVVPSGEIAISGTPIVVRIGELFDKLDRM